MDTVGADAHRSRRSFGWRGFRAFCAGGAAAAFA